MLTKPALQRAALRVDPERLLEGEGEEPADEHDREVAPRAPALPRELDEEGAHRRIAILRLRREPLRQDLPDVLGQPSNRLPGALRRLGGGPLDMGCATVVHLSAQGLEEEH